MSYHNPVLLQDSVEGLNITEDGIYVDVTFGGGGHSREIMNRLGRKGKLFAFDQDEDALENTLNDDRFILINDNFRYITQFLKFYGIRKVDGILADFGVSSHQFDVPDRGFSTRFDADLDMRMSKKNSNSAYKVINSYSQDALRQVFLEYGELRNAEAIARAIVGQREKAPIKATEELKTTLQQYLPKHKEHKILAQIYQAIRIEVNQEIKAIEEFLLDHDDLSVCDPAGNSVGQGKCASLKSRGYRGKRLRVQGVLPVSQWTAILAGPTFQSGKLIPIANDQTKKQ